MEATNLNDTFEHVPQEALHAKPTSEHAESIDLRDGHEGARTKIEVEDTDTQHRNERPENIVEEQEGVLVDLYPLSASTLEEDGEAHGWRGQKSVKLEPEQDTDTNDFLLEEVDDHVRVSVVGKMSMDEQQPLEVTELSDGVVG